MTQPTAVLSICRFSRVHFLSKKKKVESKQISPCSVNWTVSVLKPRSFPLSEVLYRSRCWGFMNAMAQSWAKDTTSWKSPVTSGLDSLYTPLLRCSVRLEVARGDLDVTLRAEHSADWVDLYQLLRQWVWGMELLLLCCKSILLQPTVPRCSQSLGHFLLHSLPNLIAMATDSCSGFNLTLG